MLLLTSPSPAQVLSLASVPLRAWETILLPLGSHPPLTSKPSGVLCFSMSETRPATWLLCVWVWEVKIFLLIWLFNCLLPLASWGIFHHTYW